MSNLSLNAATLSFCLLLAACGGGGGGSSNASSGPGGTTNAGTQDVVTSDATGGVTGDTPGSTPFSAELTLAPDNGAVLSGSTRFEIRGSAIENAELLPPDRYTPLLGRFAVSLDKRTAVLDFDTSTLPNGTLRLRILAFDKPAGSAGAQEIVAMSTRQWRIQNPSPPEPASIPDASYMPEVMLPFTHLPYVDPQALTTLWAMDDATFAAAVANWPQFEAVLRRYVPANVILDFPTPLGFSAAWESCIAAPHIATACRESVLYLRGLMLNKQTQ